MGKRLREVTQPVEVTQPFKRNRPVEMQTITLYAGAHGSEPIRHTGRPGMKSSDPHHPYGENFTVNFLSFAGLANITTQAGIIYKKRVDKPTSLITNGVASILHGKGTDYAALAYLAPNIFKEPIESQDESLRRMDIMMNEFMAMVKLADIKFSKTSPPQNFVNPFFEKRWWFDHNHRDDLRRPKALRSMPSRHAGYTEDNPILSINGLFILQTTNELHKSFSISDIRDKHKFVTGPPDIPSHLLRADAIISKNLLDTENYNNHWSSWIQAFDFSRVPDDDVIKIASVREAILILQQMLYAFTADNYNNDRDITDSLSVVIPNIKASLVSISTTIIPLIESVTGSNETVNVRRSAFNQVVHRANELEERIEELNHKSITRKGRKTIDGKIVELTNLDGVDLVRLQQELSEEKARANTLKSQLDLLKDEIVTIVTNFIRDMLISESYTPEVKTTIKNIIMRNKLRNILKFGILHKRLSLSQLVLFFRSLGYDIVNIVDPSCFVLKDARPILALDPDVDSQNLPGIRVPAISPPTGDEMTIKILNHSKSKTLTADGGTKRKKSKYSRKRRTRRKRRTTQRRRRQKRRNF